MDYAAALDYLLGFTDWRRPVVHRPEAIHNLPRMRCLLDLLDGPDARFRAVLEVGLGGRFDTVNAVTPLVSVITSLSIDHTAVLGDTIEQIAAEKAGIIKPGVPVVAQPQTPPAWAVLARTAAERGAPLHR